MDPLPPTITVTPQALTLSISPSMPRVGLAPPAAMVRATIEQHFPGLWPAVEVGLSVCATLLLADNSNPVAVIYVGGPSSSKTTVADLFAGHSLAYRSDNFTPAAFVSHAATVKRDQLKTVDLLPRIQHKVLVTPELAPIFRGKEDELTKQFAIITRVLDGQGLMTDSGTHGRRGYEGDYLFGWLGCTTHFEAKVWRIMAQLGSRLFFLVMDPEQDVTVEKLVTSIDGPSYGDRLRVCRAAVHSFLTALVVGNGGVRGVRLDASKDPAPVTEWIARLAMVLAAMRSEPTREGESYSGERVLTLAKREQPYRAHAVLHNLARGHALVHGRRQLSGDDLPMVAQVAVCSMPTECARVFSALVHAGGELTVAQVQAALGVKHPETARAVMEDLDRRGVMEYVKSSAGKPASLRFRPEWAWCASPEFQAVLGGQPVKNRGVCAVTSNLVQRRMEREGVEEAQTGGVDTHTPQNLTGSQSAPGGQPGASPGIAHGLTDSELETLGIDEEDLAEAASFNDVDPGDFDPEDVFYPEEVGMDGDHASP